MNWDLLGWSFSVLRKHKELMLFPVLGAAAAVGSLYLCGINVPAIALHRHWQMSQWLWLAPAYLLGSFGVIFFNCALAACAQASFNGEETKLSYGLHHAAERVFPILGWALLSTMVGWLLRAIEQRLPAAGKIATWLFGAAWGMATYLVVPVLIAEDRGPFGALRRSASLVKQTWGEQIRAELRFGWRALLFFVPCLILGIVGANGPRICLHLAVAAFFLGTAAIGAAHGIFEVALYRYAAHGESPAGWPPEVLSILKSNGTNTRVFDI